jgi:CubicO group peptidase (beta-lactamase class C family)
MHRLPQLALLVFCTLERPCVGQAQGRDAAMVRSLDSVLARAATETHFMGTLLVADRQRIRYARQVGLADATWGVPNAMETRFRIASVTKQFTALLVMQLVESGALRLDGTIADYLPWFPKEIAQRITLEQLLTHMSGVRDLESVPDYYATEDSTLRTHADVVKRYLMVAPEWTPGTQFRYNNADYIILGAILEEVSKVPFRTLLHTRILAPLGMVNTDLVRESAIIPKLASGYDVDASGAMVQAPAPVERFMASGAMYSTVGDMLRWNRALDRQTLLSAASTERMFRPNAYSGALGSWQFDWHPAADSTSAAPASHATVRVIERQGWIGVFRALSVRMPARGISVIIIANGGSTDLSTLSRGTGVASALIEVIERGTRGNAEKQKPRVAIGR